MDEADRHGGHRLQVLPHAFVVRAATAQSSSVLRDDELDAQSASAAVGMGRAAGASRAAS
jgi:hypothetical protein